MLGYLFFGVVCLVLAWAIGDAFVRYGLFTGLIVTGGAAVSFLIPFAIWIVIAGYLLYRISAAPRPKGNGAWQKELKEMRAKRASGSAARDFRDHAICAAEKDAHLEELLAAGALSEALRYAKEKAAQVLEAGDLRAVRIYEKYMERIRRGSS